MQESKALEESAKIMFVTLNTIFQLHDIIQLEPEDSAEPVDACQHCSDLAEAIVHYPCPTVQILTDQMVVEPLADEETLAK